MFDATEECNYSVLLNPFTIFPVRQDFVRNSEGYTVWSLTSNNNVTVIFRSVVEVLYVHPLFVSNSYIGYFPTETVIPSSPLRIDSEMFVYVTHLGVHLVKGDSL